MAQGELELRAALTPEGQIQWDLDNGASGLMEHYGELIGLMDQLGDQRWALTSASANVVGPPIQLGLVTQVPQLRLGFSFRRSDTRREYAHVRMQIYRGGERWTLRYSVAKGGDGEEPVDGPDDFTFGERVTERWKADGWELTHTLSESDATRQLFFMRAAEKSLEERNSCRRTEPGIRYEMCLRCATPGCAEKGRMVQRHLSLGQSFLLREQAHRRLCPTCLLPMEVLDSQ